MTITEEKAVEIVFAALDVGLDGACDAFDSNEIGTLDAGDGFNVRTVVIGGVTYEVYVSPIRVKA